MKNKITTFAVQQGKFSVGQDNIAGESTNLVSLRHDFSAKLRQILLL